MGTWRIPLPIFSTVALGVMTVLAVSTLLALTLVPALLAMLWPAIQAESRKVPADGKATAWHAWANLAMKRPVFVSLLASFLLAACLLPLVKLKVAIPDASSLPQRYDSRTAAEMYQAQFVSPSSSQVYIVAEGGANRLRPEDWRQAYALVGRLERDPNVLRVDSVFSGMRAPGQAGLLLRNPDLAMEREPALRTFVHGNRMLLQATIRGSPGSKGSMDWLRRWEREGAASELRFLLGGEAKYQQEVFDAVYSCVGPALLFILAADYIVLFAAFRSVLLPIKIVAMNLLSLGAAYGTMAWICEGGRFGMEPSSIAIMIPVFIFGLVYGISMDYGVFLVSRIYEAYRETRDNDRAVRSGLASAGRIITSAAAIMMAVTAPFALGDVVGVRQLGVGIAAAVFIDATLVRMALVPALMKWLGRWNWWAPGWMR
jgi:RND superfamily putative drug exporter